MAGEQLFPRYAELWFRLARRFPGGDVVPPCDSPEWAGVSPWLRAHAARAVRIYSVALLVALLVGWPTDAFLLQGDPVQRATMREWRLGTVALLAVQILLAFRWGAAARRPVAFIAAASAVACTWTAWSIGRIGGFDSPWPYYLYFAQMAPAPVPSWNRYRLSVHLALAASFFAGFCLLHPQNMASPYFGDAMAFLAMVALFGIVVGEVIFINAVIQYFQRLRQEVSAASLLELNRTLDARVQAQTAELRALSRHLVHVQEGERTRIAAELHDDLGQQLAAARFLVSAAERGWPQDGPQAAAMREVQERIGAANDSVRALVGTLRPLVVDQVGLAAACASLTRTMATSAGLAHEYNRSGDLDALPADVNVTVYRVLQEALTNVVRHAQASAIDVDLCRQEGRLVLSVRDDGRGMPAAPEPRGDGGGMGLIGMRERALSVGGDLALGPAPGGGALVRLEIPLPRPEDEP